jgi:hypothetical protein
MSANSKAGKILWPHEIDRFRQQEKQRFWTTEDLFPGVCATD